MIEAITLWNEPNNLSHWDFNLDPDWRQFSTMIRLAAEAVRQERPDLTLVLGGIDPIDERFIRLLSGHGLLEYLDIVALHGFPLDWSDWRIDEWPEKLAEIEAVTRLPIWVTESGASSFGAEEVQVFGLRRTTEVLKGRVERVYWSTLLDLPPTWEPIARHKENEGGAYGRHFCTGLVRADGTPKPALREFDPELGICQWFHFNDPRLNAAVKLLKKMGVKRLRTGISWADWHRPGALEWFDRQMAALEDFDLTLTLCFTPPSRGIRYCHTSPPARLEEFAAFAVEVVRRYVPAEQGSLYRLQASEPASFAGSAIHWPPSF